VPGTHPKSELILNDGAAERGPHFVAGASAIGCGKAGARVTAGLGQTRLRLDEADGTALSARAEQCALGSLQNLHAIESKTRGVRIGSRDNTVVQADLDGHVIDG